MTTWLEYKKTKRYPKLDKDIKVDVAVIGGGMAGILTAYQLSQAGCSVALLEKSELGSGATSYTTAFITKAIDSDLTQIASIFGKREAKAVWQSGQKAIEEFERIIEEEGMDCEFVRCPNFVFASSNRQGEKLDDEFGAYREFKIPAKLHDSDKNLGFKHYGAIEVPGQAKFHPLKFLYSLGEVLSEKGVQVFEKTAVKNIDGDGPLTLKTAEGNVIAQDAVITTYKPLTNEKTHLKKAMYRSYIFEVELPKGKFKEALYEDSSNPYYYFRIDPQDGYDRMIVGGEDHKDIFGDTLKKQSFEGLDKFLKKLTRYGEYRIKKRWSGGVLEPSDGLPLIGRIAPHLYVATGFSGNGMTYSMISSLLLTDLITRGKNSWAKVYEPERTLLHPKRLGSKARDYIEEFFGGAVKNLLS
jgi:glycine/D-amino acid oxidase-like deaminating enzyme